MLTPTDWLNIICFMIAETIAITCILLIKKMKLPDWKFRIAWIILMQVIGVILLISRLAHAIW